MARKDAMFPSITVDGQEFDADFTDTSALKNANERVMVDFWKPEGDTESEKFSYIVANATKSVPVYARGIDSILGKGATDKLYDRLDDVHVLQMGKLVTALTSEAVEAYERL